MNKFFITGNIVKDPDLQQTQGGVIVCRFTVAVNRPYTNGDGEKKTDFFNVTCWRGLAESVAKYCQKGSKVAVSGSVQLRQWEDNKGNKRDAVDVIAQDVEFLSKPTQREESDPYDPTPRQKPKPKQQRMEIFDDDGSDIPF